LTELELTKPFLTMPLADVGRVVVEVFAIAPTSVGSRPATMKENKVMIGPHGDKLLETFEAFTDTEAETVLETTRRGIVAGAAGGLAEMAWVTLYAVATGADPATFARGVTTAAGMQALFPAAPVASGVTVHMAFAVTLGIALSFGWRALSSYRLVAASPFPFVLAALLSVWAVNFFVVLPIISPAFIHLAPYPISLMSKVLFGLAAAEAFRRQAASTLKARSRSLMSCTTPLHFRKESRI
jgi:hypothetical protein